MANKIKGEVSFESGDTLYTFKLGTNAQAIIEDRVGMTVSKWMASKGESMGAGDIRLLFYAGLFQKHQLTEQECGDLIDEIGAQRAAGIFLEAVSAAAPNATNGAAEPHPQKPAKERIGMNS